MEQRAVRRGAQGIRVQVFTARRGHDAEAPGGGRHCRRRDRRHGRGAWRGHADEEAFKTAHAVLARGDIVVMYAEAGRSRSGELNKPRHGLGRLALESGAAVVPTAIAGTERVRNWRRLQFPKVTVQYGDPIKFDRVVEDPTRDQSQAASEAIFERIEKVYYGLAENGRKRSIEAAAFT